MLDLHGSSFTAFITLTVIFFGGISIMTGQALARGWQSLWKGIGYALLMAIGNRLLLWALLEGSLTKIIGLLIDWGYCAAMVAITHRVTLVHKMINQYPWLYERAGLFSWREKAQSR